MPTVRGDCPSVGSIWTVALAYLHSANTCMPLVLPGCSLEHELRKKSRPAAVCACNATQPACAAVGLAIKEATPSPVATSMPHGTDIPVGCEAVADRLREEAPPIAQ